MELLKFGKIIIFKFILIKNIEVYTKHLNKSNNIIKFGAGTKIKLINQILIIHFSKKY